MLRAYFNAFRSRIRDEQMANMITKKKVERLRRCCRCSEHLRKSAGFLARPPARDDRVTEIFEKLETRTYYPSFIFVIQHIEGRMRDGILQSRKGIVW